MIYILHLLASDKENAPLLSCFINRDDSDVSIGRWELARAFAYQTKHKHTGRTYYWRLHVTSRYILRGNACGDTYTEIHVKYTAVTAAAVGNLINFHFRIQSIMYFPMAQSSRSFRYVSLVIFLRALVDR